MLSVAALLTADATTFTSATVLSIALLLASATNAIYTYQLLATNATNAIYTY